jgi:hypothetical protein
LSVHGVDHEHRVVPVHERGHDQGDDHDHDHRHGHHPTAAVIANSRRCATERID